MFLRRLLKNAFRRHSERSEESLFARNLSLKSEVEEGFLRSGTAKTAVPPVGLTCFG
jgi:hypothetical protein